MKVTLIEKSKNKLVFEVDGEGDTLFSPLVKILSQYDDVIQASFHIYHPLNPLKGKFILKTKNEDALELLKKALKELRNYVEKI